MAASASTSGTLKRAFRIVSPTCEDMTALVSAMLDGELPWTTRLRMRVHFLYCSYCRRMRDHFALLQKVCARLDGAIDAAPESGLDDAAKAALRAALRGER